MQTYLYFLGVKNGQTLVKVKYVVEKFIQSQVVDHIYAKLPNLMEVPICTASANPSGPPTITSIQVNRGLVFIFVI